METDDNSKKLEVPLTKEVKKMQKNKVEIKILKAGKKKEGS